MVLSVMISKKNRKLHFHAPLEHFFNYKACALGVKNVKKNQGRSRGSVGSLALKGKKCPNFEIFRNFLNFVEYSHATLETLFMEVRLG